MRTIYMVMATYLDAISSGGTIAHRTVKMLRDKGFRVIVLTSEINVARANIDSNVVSIPLGCNYYTTLLLSRVGLIDDYLHYWIDNVLCYLKDAKLLPTSNDIVLATTVGELGTIKLGVILKEKYGCKLYIHFHDPIKHALVNGKKYGKYELLPYASREKQENLYLHKADRIITCCDTFRVFLSQKYPDISSMIQNCYFGWLDDANPSNNEVATQNKRTDLITIAYGGNFGWPQGPEIIAKAAQGLRRVKVVYIGNWCKYKPVLRLRNNELVELLPRMSRNEYQDYMKKNIDVAFLSLSREYFSACVPAKLYEYINITKPILAALPPGDAKDIINNNGYGEGVNYSIESVRNAIGKISTVGYQFYIDNIRRDKNKWNIEHAMGGFIKLFE